MPDTDMRQLVARFGINVVCMGCGRHWKHRPEREGRLRKRLSECCGSPMLSLAYAKRNRDKARAKVLAYRATRTIFD
jgi:hypothetical protein